MIRLFINSFFALFFAVSLQAEQESFHNYVERINQEIFNSVVHWGEDTYNHFDYLFNGHLDHCKKNALKVKSSSEDNENCDSPYTPPIDQSKQTAEDVSAHLSSEIPKQYIKDKIKQSLSLIKAKLKGHTETLQYANTFLESSPEFIFSNNELDSCESAKKHIIKNHYDFCRFIENNNIIHSHYKIKQSPHSRHDYSIRDENKIISEVKDYETQSQFEGYRESLIRSSGVYTNSELWEDYGYDPIDKKDPQQIKEALKKYKKASQVEKKRLQELQLRYSSLLKDPQKFEESFNDPQFLTEILILYDPEEEEFPSQAHAQAVCGLLSKVLKHKNHSELKKMAVNAALLVAPFGSGKVIKLLSQAVSKLHQIKKFKNRATNVRLAYILNHRAFTLGVEGGLLSGEIYFLQKEISDQEIQCENLNIKLKLKADSSYQDLKDVESCYSEVSTKKGFLVGLVAAPTLGYLMTKSDALSLLLRKNKGAAQRAVNKERLLTSDEFKNFVATHKLEDIAPDDAVHAFVKAVGEDGLQPVNGSLLYVDDILQKGLNDGLSKQFVDATNALFYKELGQAIKQNPELKSLLDKKGYNYKSYGELLKKEASPQQIKALEESIERALKKTEDEILQLPGAKEYFQESPQKRSAFSNISCWFSFGFSNKGFAYSSFDSRKSRARCDQNSSKRNTDQKSHADSDSDSSLKIHGYEANRQKYNEDFNEFVSLHGSLSRNPRLRSVWKSPEEGLPSTFTQEIASSLRKFSHPRSRKVNVNGEMLDMDYLAALKSHLNKEHGLRLNIGDVSELSRYYKEQDVFSTAIGFKPRKNIKNSPYGETNFDVKDLGAHNAVMNSSYILQAKNVDDAIKMAGDGFEAATKRLDDMKLSIERAYEKQGIKVIKEGDSTGAGQVELIQSGDDIRAVYREPVDPEKVRQVEKSLAQESAPLRAVSVLPNDKQGDIAFINQALERELNVRSELIVKDFEKICKGCKTQLRVHVQQNSANKAEFHLELNRMDNNDPGELKKMESALRLIHNKWKLPLAEDLGL